MTITLQAIAERLAAKLVGDPHAIITSIGALDKAQPGQITFLENPHYKKYLESTQATAVIVKEEYAPLVKTNALIVKDPYVGYAKISVLFDDAPKVPVGIHPTAIVGKDCVIGPNVAIGPYCVIGDQVTLGKNVQIAAGCVIGDETTIGDNTRLCAKVIIYHKVKIGSRVILHSGVVVGSDGFGNANENGQWRKIYQLGTAVIGNDVEIGANTTIDRGAIEDTIIEDGVRLDNQIQVGHNVRIGAHTAIAGCVGIAGSTKIGRYCMIGGGVGINGHIEITDGVIVTGMSSVGKSITQRGVYSSGVPAIPHKSWWRNYYYLTNLESLVRRLTAMEKKYHA